MEAEMIEFDFEFSCMNRLRALRKLRELSSPLYGLWLKNTGMEFTFVYWYGDDIYCFEYRFSLESAHIAPNNYVFVRRVQIQISLYNILCILDAGFN